MRWRKGTPSWFKWAVANWEPIAGLALLVVFFAFCQLLRLVLSRVL